MTVLERMYRRYQALLAETRSTPTPPLARMRALAAMTRTKHLARTMFCRAEKVTELEDELDAVTCAMIAWYLWRHGPAGSIVYGTVADGHIIVPRCPPQIASVSSAEIDIGAVGASGGKSCNVDHHLVGEDP